jgi:hypothetical protein
LAILEGGADKIANAGTHNSLKSLYTEARVRTFPGAGPAISAEPRRERADAIAEFLCQAPVIQ